MFVPHESRHALDVLDLSLVTFEYAPSGGVLVTKPVAVLSSQSREASGTIHVREVATDTQIYQC